VTTVRAVACAIASVIIAGTCVAQVAPVQVPANDPNAIYATARANPSLKWRGEIAQRVETILQKQGNFSPHSSTRGSATRAPRF
jgi:hypothetical protein